MKEKDNRFILGIERENDTFYIGESHEPHTNKRNICLSGLMLPLWII